MDSQHRHELEENTLASWLADKIETLKPQIPAILLGVVVLVAAIIGINSWKTSSAAASADRWEDFAIALEQGSPDLVDLKNAADKNPGTPVADWADATWADGKLYQASQLFFSNRSEADKAVEEAVAVYERLVKSKDRDIAERASFQLGRALELQGKLDEAIKQYGRVTGGFALVAKDRILQLERESVKQSYEWITTAKATGSASAGDAGGVLDSLDPDDIPLPDMTAEEADSALDSLLQDVEKEETSESDGAAAAEEMIESEASEAEAEVPAEEDAAAPEETPAADEAATDKPAAE